MVIIVCSLSSLCPTVCTSPNKECWKPNVAYNENYPIKKIIIILSCELYLEVVMSLWSFKIQYNSEYTKELKLLTTECATPPCQDALHVMGATSQEVLYVLLCQTPPIDEMTKATHPAHVDSGSQVIKGCTIASTMLPNPTCWWNAMATSNMIAIVYCFNVCTCNTCAFVLLTRGADHDHWRPRLILWQKRTKLWGGKRILKVNIAWDGAHGVPTFWSSEVHV